MSTEAHVYMRRQQGAKVEHFDVSNVIYHKFSHDAVSYTLNGENVNIMLEYVLNVAILRRCVPHRGDVNLSLNLCDTLLIKHKNFEKVH